MLHFCRAGGSSCFETSRPVTESEPPAVAGRPDKARPPATAGGSDSNVSPTIFLLRVPGGEHGGLAFSGQSRPELRLPLGRLVVEPCQGSRRGVPNRSEGESLADGLLNVDL